MADSIKLRQLEHFKSLSSPELEVLRFNFWLIEQGLNSVGASSPLVPGSGTPPTGDHHLLINLTTFDDHPQYAYLAGRTGGQTLYGGTTFGGKLNLHGYPEIGNYTVEITSNPALGLINMDPAGTHGGGFIFIRMNGNSSGFGAYSDFLRCSESGTDKVEISSLGSNFYGNFATTGTLISGDATIGYNVKVLALSSTSIPLILRGAAGQSVNLQEWQNNTPAALALIDSGGNLKLLVPTGLATTVYSVTGITHNDTTTAATFLIQGDAFLALRGGTGGGGKLTLGFNSSGVRADLQDGNAADISLKIRQAPAQTADLTQWTDSTGATPVLVINKGGDFVDDTFAVCDNGDATKRIVLQLSGITTATTRTYTGPDANGTILLDTTLGAIAIDFIDSTFRVVDNTTPTKKLAFECSGITAATTRTLTVPNASGTIAILTGLSQTWTALNTHQNLTTWSTNFKLFDPSGFVNASFDISLNTGDHIYVLPDFDGTVALIQKDQVWDTGLQKFSTFTFSLFDSADSTKILVYSLAGITTGNTRTWLALDYTGFQTIVGSALGAPSAGQLGRRNLKNQVANIGTTNLSNTPTAGVYEVEVILICTVADATAGTLATAIGATDDLGAFTVNATPGFSLAVTGRTYATIPVQVASGNITYATTITGIYGTAKYSLYLRVIALS